MTDILSRLLQALALMLLAHGAAQAQSAQDQADPAVIEEELRQEDRPRQQSAPAPKVEPRAPARVALSTAIMVGAIRVEGAQVLPASAFAPVVERYVGLELGPDEMRALATEIANVARQAGYGLATAWIPAQRLDTGVLRVRIEEGRIDAVKADGPAAKPVERYLSELADGSPVTTRRLERALLIAGDIAGVSVRDSRLERRGERNILLVRANRRDVQARAQIDNWGSDEVGPVRLRLTADIHGLIADDDRVTIGGVVTPFEPDEFWLVRAGYTKGVGTGGTKVSLNAYYAQSNPGGSLSRRDYDGESIDAELGVEHPLVRTRSTSVWARGELGIRRSNQHRDGRPTRDDRTTTASAGLYATTRSTATRARGEVTVTRGLDLLDATRRGEPLASRRDAGGVFTKAEFWGDVDHRLGSGFSLRLAAQAQLADRPLLSAEEFGLGGRYFLRGYDYREMSGENGAAASAELRYALSFLPKPVRSSQLYLYGDAGTVDNLSGGFGGGSLASAGGGLRFDLDILEAEAEIGIPLSDGLDGDRPDPRFSFTVGTRF